MKPWAPFSPLLRFTAQWLFGANGITESLRGFWGSPSLTPSPWLYSLSHPSAERGESAELSDARRHHKACNHIGTKACFPVRTPHGSRHHPRKFRGMES